jgi:hypothetical protein
VRVTQREIEKSIKKINGLLHDLDKEAPTGPDERNMVHSYRQKLIADADALLTQADALRSQQIVRPAR